MTRTSRGSINYLLASSCLGIVVTLGIAMLFNHGEIVMRILSKRQFKELVLYSPQHMARLEKAGTVVGAILSAITTGLTVYSNFQTSVALAQGDVSIGQTLKSFAINYAVGRVGGALGGAAGGYVRMSVNYAGSGATDVVSQNADGFNSGPIISTLR